MPQQAVRHILPPAHICGTIALATFVAYTMPAAAATGSVGKSCRRATCDYPLPPLGTCSLPHDTAASSRHIRRSMMRATIDICKSCVVFLLLWLKMLLLMLSINQRFLLPRLWCFCYFVVFIAFVFGFLWHV